MRRGRTATPLASALTILLLAAAAAAQAVPEVSLATADERPLRGEVVRLAVEADGSPAAGYRVVAVYRPNSQTSHEEELVAVDASGSVLWTPLFAGPVTLAVWPPGADREASGASPVTTHTLAVRHGHFPPSGLLIMVLAGLLLFGGAAAAMVLLLQPGGGAPPVEPPST